ncbi:MAG TPA: hypothetical protein VGN04_12235 [Herbaspirillum sp.]
MIAAAIGYLPSENAAIQHENGSWRLRDDAALHFEAGDDAMLVVLSMPETHLDLHQLEQLLILCGQGWPLPLSAGLSADETRALIFTRLDIDGLGIEHLSQAMSVLLHARERWLRAGAAR